MSAAALIAAALNGREEGDGWRISCPVHGPERTPSCVIWDAPYGLGAKCWSRGCAPKAIRAALVARGVIGRDGLTRRMTEAEAAAFRRAQSVANENSIRAANDLYGWSRPLPGTLAERYLRKERGLKIELPDCIRFMPPGAHEAWKLDPLDWKERERFMAEHGLKKKDCYYVVHGPALIVPVHTDERITGVHVILLDDAGKKRPEPDLPDALLWWNPKRSPGVLGSGAVRLAPATNVLGLAEGVEDALAATELTGVPCWAALGSGRMTSVAVPSSVCELHAFIDNDSAGQKAGEELAALHTAAGRRVMVHRPPEGFKDPNDILLAGVRA